MKGGKVLGKGGYGCVIQPAIMCKKEDDPTNKVSKIIRMDRLSKENQKELNEEFYLSQKFKKIDIDNKYFLGGIDKCTLKSSKIPIADLKGCKFPVHKEIDIMNIVMTIGEDFNKIASKLNTVELFKTLAHLLIGAKKSLDLNIVLLDIKYENLLFVKDQKNKKLIHPVFIDFSPSLIMQSEDQFADFLKMGTSYYFVWPIEILLATYLADTKKHIKLPPIPKIMDSKKVIEKYEAIKMHNAILKKTESDFYYNLLRYENYDMKKRDYKKLVIQFYKSLEKDYKNTMSKILVYQISKAFVHLKNKNFNKIIKNMTEQDFNKRLNIDESLRVIEKEIGLITDKKMLINYKKVTKLKNIADLFSNYFIKKKQKKQKKQTIFIKVLPKL